MSSWSDVDDHGEPELKRRWRRAPRSPPRADAVTVRVPIDLVDSERAVPQ